MIGEAGRQYVVAWDQQRTEEVTGVRDRVRVVVEEEKKVRRKTLKRSGKGLNLFITIE